MNDIKAEVLIALIKRTIKFPYPQICKHLVACDLLQILEEAGNPVSQELARAVVRAEDERAVKLLENYARLF
jgi:hypothetical protein